MGELPNVRGTLKCPVPTNHGNYRDGCISREAWANYGSVFSTVAAPTTSTGASMWGYGIDFGNDEKHAIIQPYIPCNFYKRLT